MTGILDDNHTRQYWQDNIDTTTIVSYGSLLQFLITEFQGSYPSSFTAIPDCEIQINYYDSYEDAFFNGFAFNTGHSTHYLTGAQMIAPAADKFVYGLLTGSKTTILNNTSLNTSINTRYYYDREGRPIQVQTQNPWNTSSNYDYTTFQYNFSGQKVLEVTKHFAPNGNSNTKPTTLVQDRL